MNVDDYKLICHMLKLTHKPVCKYYFDICYAYWKIKTKTLSPKY